MSKRWTDINESLEDTRNQRNLLDEYDYQSDMTPMEASMAISEGISFSAESKYIAEGLYRDMLSFNKKAEEKGYDTMEYIAEAFSIGGIFKRIVDFMMKIWGAIVNFFKGLFSGNSKGSSGSAEAVKVVVNNIEESGDDLIKRIKDIHVTLALPDNSKEVNDRKAAADAAEKERKERREGKIADRKAYEDVDGRIAKSKRNEFYRNKAKEAIKAKEDAAYEEEHKWDEARKAKAERKANKPKVEQIKVEKSPRIHLMQDQMEAFHEMISKIKVECEETLKKFKVEKAVKYNRTISINGRGEAYDNTYGTPIASLASSVYFSINNSKASKSDVREAIASMKTLLDGAGKDAKARSKGNKLIFEKLVKFKSSPEILKDTASNIMRVGGAPLALDNQFYKNNGDLYNAKDINGLLSNFGNFMTAGTKDVTPVDNAFDWLSSLETLSNCPVVMSIDDIAKGCEDIFSEIKDMKSRIDNLSTESNPEMSENSISTYNDMSSKMMTYQSYMQEITTRIPGFIIQAYQRYLDLVSSEYNKFAHAVMVRI